MDPYYFHVLKNKYKMIIVSGIVVAVISLVITLLFPLEYRADAQVLIISRSRYGVDPYTTVKSAERIGENIAQVMETNDFYNKVMEQSGYNIDKSRFTNVSERTKRKRWQKAIDGSIVYGTGVLNVSAYSRTQEQALQLAGAAVSALSSQGWEYVGGDVIIKVVNEPVATRFPARPNLVLNAILGFLAGVLGAGLVLYRLHIPITYNL